MSAHSLSDDDRQKREITLSVATESDVINRVGRAYADNCVAHETLNSLMSDAENSSQHTGEHEYERFRGPFGQRV
jgi:hypothetical protein